MTKVNRNPVWCSGGCGTDLAESGEVVVREDGSMACVRCEEFDAADRERDAAELAFEFSQECAEHRRNWTPDNRRSGR